jgi:hypothetical protein
VAEPRIREAAEKYALSGLEVGAGETFDQPELWEWLGIETSRGPTIYTL